MKQIDLSLVLCAILAPAFSLSGEAVTTGNTLDQVLLELGKPASSIEINGHKVLFYERGRIEITAGAVVRAELISEEEAQELREQRAVELAQRREELRLLREKRMLEGAAVLERKLDDFAFLNSPATKRLAFWRSFHRSYPEISLPDDYFIAARERELELKEARAEQRLRELAEATARASAEAAAASDRDGYGFSRGYSPYYAVGLPFVSDFKPDHRSRRFHRHTHRTHNEFEATFIPFNGTAGFAFQRENETQPEVRTRSTAVRHTIGNADHLRGTSRSSREPGLRTRHLGRRHPTGKGEFLTRH